ncbi:MAG: hypothetical protein ACOC4K_04715, partial [Verrucomicrobiota bacterium]
LITLSALSLSATAAFSQDDEIITVQRLDFNSLQDDWIQMEVELRANRNTLEDARDPGYVEDIKITLYVGYLMDEAERKFDYYTSDVEIVIMERNDTNHVYFYLPGLIAERDRLRDEPDFYYAEVSIGGEEQPPQENAMSGNIPNLEILEKFISNANSEGAVNEDKLMPIYLVPGDRIGRVRDLPIFLRRDVRD